MASERAEFIANMNLEQVEAALAKARASGEETIKMNGRLAESMTHVESVGTKIGARAGKMASALVSLNGVVGETSDAMGKVVGGAGRLASAWSVGGGLAMGITAITVLVKALNDHLAETLKRQDELLASSFAVTDKASQMINALREQAQKERDRFALSTSTGPEREMLEFAMSYREQMKAANALMANADQHIRSIGKGARKQIDEIIALRAEAMRVEAATAKRIKRGARAAAEEDPLLAEDWMPAEQTLQELLDAEQAIRDRADEIERAQEEKAAKENLRIWREQDEARIALARETADRLQRLRDMENELALEKRKAQAKAIADIVSDTAALAGKFASESLIAQQNADRLAAESAEARAESQRLAAAGMADASAAAQKESARLEAESVAAREAALMDLIAAASHAAGGMIMLTGGEIIAKGVAELLATGGASPIGWAQTLGGAGLVAAGAAIQTGGPEAVGALLGMGGAGSAAATTDRGAPLSRRSGGRRGSGGEAGAGITIVNQWGVAGPTADDQARAMSRVLDRMRDGRFS